jgi:hypothetical protein
MVGRPVNDANPYPFRQKESEAGRLPTCALAGHGYRGLAGGGQTYLSERRPALSLKRG